MSTVRVTATDGSEFEFRDEIIGQGGMKDVYFAPDRSYVVCFFRESQDAVARERLSNLVGSYREGIYAQEGGDYWKEIFCWPTHVVEHNGRLGLICPTYPSQFYFDDGTINNDMLGLRGKEKVGKWFVTHRHLLDPKERGNWASYIRICLLISRAVRRMHAAGLAHSDLSYKNVLVDPRGMTACIIDIDGLVVPGKFPPDVVGTPGFIAPEVYRTQHLDPRDPNRALPSRHTDCHALAVLIYNYLLSRHPLDGRMVCDPANPTRDDMLRFGEQALFIEHPTDRRNRPNRKWLQKNCPPNRLQDMLPWADPDALPYDKVLGDALRVLVDRAFIQGLQDPKNRPAANEWEIALVRTWDLVLKCSSNSCAQGYYVYDNSRQPRCPVCGTRYGRSIPVLDFYTDRGGGKYRPDNHRLVAFDGQGLHHWHANSRVFPNEKLPSEKNTRLGYFTFHEGRWLLVNEGLTDLKDVQTGREIPTGKYVELKSGLQLLLQQGTGGRVVNVQIAG